MKPETAAQLLEINRRFYSECGESFAATRRRIQPGIRRVLDEWIPLETPQDWLDLGCGSGALGQVWAADERKGTYTGIDFSEPALEQARRETEPLSNETLLLRYIQGDLMDPRWTDGLAASSFDGLLAFASLHHIPGEANHRRIFRDAARLLKPGGQFIFSVWQFQNSPKLLERVRPWSDAGIAAAELEPGDSLLDWRSGTNGLRYVHLFSEESLRNLAEDSGFQVEDVFYSDGKEGNLALYMRAFIAPSIEYGGIMRQM